MRKLLLFASMLLGPAAFADTLYFGFTFLNVDSGATAVGQLSIDSTVLSTILADPTNDGFPIADLESLSITVSGATDGNGTYGLADFDTFNWWSAGATFDLSQDLVGQPTTENPPFNPWGTADGQSGDFNFFNSSPTAPNGVFFFNLGANGGGADSMQLTSLQTTPEPGAMGLVGLAGCAMLAFRRILARRG